MAQITVGGCDPSLAAFGMCKGVFDTGTSLLTITAIALIETKPKSKKDVRTNSHDVLRAKKLYESMQEFFADCTYVATEIPVGSQMANGMKSYGICCALMATLKQPLIQLTAEEVKLSSGIRNASKAQMIAWATSEYPRLDWPMFAGKYANKSEHMADAIGALTASLRTDEFKLITSTQR